MLKKLKSSGMGKSNLGWLKSNFHFSFAEYYNPKNMGFGVLRVINDDLVEENTGFETHHHKDMEIISYVIDGQLTHKDSMGSQSTLHRGDFQYMSAGTGVFHSEHNLGNSLARFLQIWILPDKKGHKPNYGEYKLDWNLRENNWLYVVGSQNSDAPIKINQDVNLYVLSLESEKTITFSVKENRQAYMVQIEGESTVNDLYLEAMDGLEIVEDNISIYAKQTSNFLVIEMKKEN